MNESRGTRWPGCRIDSSTKVLLRFKFHGLIDKSLRNISFDQIFGKIWCITHKSALNTEQTKQKSVTSKHLLFEHFCCIANFGGKPLKLQLPDTWLNWYYHLNCTQMFWSSFWFLLDLSMWVHRTCSHIHMKERLNRNTFEWLADAFFCSHIKLDHNLI